MRELFSRIKTVAVVGYSDNVERAGHFVPAYLSQQGYNIIAVNPKFNGSVDGFPAYPDLASIPQDIQVDVVDVFRSPDAVPAIADAVGKLKLRPSVFWMQPGAVSEEAAGRARQLGLQVISWLCMLAEHRKLQG